MTKGDSLSGTMYRFCPEIPTHFCSTVFVKGLLTGCLSSVSVVFCFVLFFVTRGCQESLWWLLRLFSMDLKFTVHRLKTWLIGFKAWLSYSLTCSLSKSLRLSLPQFLYSIENTVLVLTAFRGLKCIKVQKALRLGLAT